MAHLLDGYDVQRGDAVYDVAYGAGRVTHLADNGSITVTFGDGRQAGYTDGRTRRFPQRTLYWKDPVVAVPAKDATLWNCVKAAAAAVANTLHTTGARPNE